MRPPTPPPPRAAPHPADPLEPADLHDPAVPFLQRVYRPDGALKGVYFRRRGWRRFSLRLGAGAPLLADQVAAILAQHAPPGASDRPVDVAGAGRAYQLTPAFAGLARGTRVEYLRLLKEFDRDFGHALLADLDAAFLLALKDAWTTRGYKACNDRLSVLAAALLRPTQLGDVTPGLFRLVGRATRPRDLPEPHPAWTDGEVVAVIDAAIEEGAPGLARAVALGRWTGARPGDAVRLSESALSRGRLQWVASKNRKALDLPVDPALAAVLARTPRRAVTIAYRPDGSSWPNVRQYQRDLRAFLDALAARGRVRAGLDAYGLRHAYGVEHALRGASDAQLQALLGDLTPAMAARYRRQAEERRLVDEAMAVTAAGRLVPLKRESEEG